MPTAIRRIAGGDRAAWASLWGGYLAFYRTQLPPETTERTWQRLTGGDPSMGAFVAEQDGDLVGFVHFVLHPTTWTTTPACYLEDLFVNPASRGAGTGGALIEHLVATGRERGWSGIHW